MKNYRQILLTLGAILLMVACSSDAQQAIGFRLPDGDVAKGEAAFVRLECHSCHSVAGVQMPEPTADGPVNVELGGSVGHIKTYGDLVTSIINPSHKLISRYPAEEVSRDGESLMQNYNDRLRVAELIDLVAFLQPKYDVIVPDFRYRGYQYGL